MALDRYRPWLKQGMITEIRGDGADDREEVIGITGLCVTGDIKLDLLVTIHMQQVHEVADVQPANPVKRSQVDI